MLTDKQSGIIFFKLTLSNLKADETLLPALGICETVLSTELKKTSIFKINIYSATSFKNLYCGTMV